MQDLVTITMGCIQGQTVTGTDAAATTPLFIVNPDIYPSSVAGGIAEYTIAGITWPGYKCPVTYQISSSKDNVVPLLHTRLTVAADKIRIDTGTDERYFIYIVAFMGVQS